MNQVATCNTCKYFTPNVSRRDDARKTGSPTPGNCRGMPPSKIIGRDAQGAETLGGYWCSLWKHKDDGGSPFLFRYSKEIAQTASVGVPVDLAIDFVRKLIGNDATLKIGEFENGDGTISIFVSVQDPSTQQTLEPVAVRVIAPEDEGTPLAD